MSTELPAHLWEKIVDNLPPPPPKFAQTVVLFADDNREVKLNISKGICVEAGFSRTMAWTDVRTHWTRTLAFPDAMHVCTSAVCLGYFFQDERSMDALEKYGSRKSVVAKDDEHALRAFEKMIPGTMVIMVKK